MVLQGFFAHFEIVASCKILKQLTYNSQNGYSKPYGSDSEVILMKSDRNIIIDCDPGTDDALALALASVYMKENIICLFSSYGNAALDNTHRNLLGLADLLGIRTTVLRGFSCPAGKSEFVATDYHGENGLCGITLPVPSAHIEHDNCVDKVYELIKTNRKVTYVVLGPLTNLAELLSGYPHVIDMIDEVVIMGGGLQIGNTSCGAEYNFSLDPPSDYTVLNSPVRKVLATLDLTHSLAFSASEVEQIVGSSRSDSLCAPPFPYSIMSEIFYRNLESSINHGNNGAIIHDAATIAYLLSPRECVIETNRLQCDDKGRLVEAQDGAPAERIKRMDKNYLKNLLKGTFQALRNKTSEQIE